MAQATKYLWVLIRWLLAFGKFLHRGFSGRQTHLNELKENSTPIVKYQNPHFKSVRAHWFVCIVKMKPVGLTHISTKGS